MGSAFFSATYLFFSEDFSEDEGFFFLSAFSAISAFLWASSSSKVIWGLDLGVSRIFRYAKMAMTMTTTMITTYVTQLDSRLWSTTTVTLNPLKPSNSPAGVHSILRLCVPIERSLIWIWMVLVPTVMSCSMVVIFLSPSVTVIVAGKLLSL